MKRHYSYLLTLLLSASAAAGQDVAQHAKPWTRWWWMGNAVDSAGIKKEMQQFHDAGIGGVEIVPIYGVKGAESRFRDYLSPSWLRMLDYTVTVARELDMGVYISVGTGWPIGGPQVTLTDAATKLVIQDYTIDANHPVPQSIQLNDKKQAGLEGTGLAALVAYDSKGKATELTAKVSKDGRLNWKPAGGSWKLYAAFTAKTLQKVKRAAPGGEGYTIDHFAAPALQHYLRDFDAGYGKAARGVQVFYNDSYEVYNADWSSAFFEAFRKRRGYDLRLHLDVLAGVDSSERAARVKSDFRETMSDLMLEHFALPFTKWAQAKGGLSLNQAHGSPANLLDLYAAADIPETESFGSTAFGIRGLRRDSADIRSSDPDPDMMKFASSAGHATGQNLVSCETFTWLTEHFKTSWARCKPEAEQVWLAGINHIFYHGTTYSPVDAVWPGWMFYASVEFNPANSLWPHLSALNGYIGRCQQRLQQGRPDNELMVYWPVYDAWHKAKGLDMPFRVHNVEDWLYGSSFHNNIKQLQQAGYGVDFVSDHMLQQMQVHEGLLQVTAKGASSKILVIPDVAHMPLQTLKAIVRIAAEGATVILQDIPGGLPGLGATSADSKAFAQVTAGWKAKQLVPGISVVTLGKGKLLIAVDTRKALQEAGLQPESLVSTGLKFIRRNNGDGKSYFLVNHTGRDIDTIINLQATAQAVQLYDPLNDKAGWVGTGAMGKTTTVRIQLASGQSLFVTSTNKMVKGIPWKYTTATGQDLPLNQAWSLHFKEGGPLMPADKTMNAPVYWNTFKDAENFSGTGSYSTSFTCTPKQDAAYKLVLTGLRESAHIWINGQDAGFIWSNPMETDITPYLKSGNNTIVIEVANLMANRIRYMDREKMEWRNYHEINFVNIDYKKFDASDWAITPSGLAGPVIIREFKTAP